MTSNTGVVMFGCGWIALAVLLSGTAKAKTRSAHLVLPQQDNEAWQFHVEGSGIRALSEADIDKKQPLRKYVKSIEAQSGNAIIYTVVRPVYGISSDILAALFPKTNFYIVRYQMKKHPRFKGAIAIAGGLYNVIGVNDRGEHAEFYGYGNYDEFGGYLASNRVRLSNAEEGRQIWAAYCHIYRKGWPRAEHRRAETTEWHLEPHIVGDREYYYEIRTNDEGTVLSGVLQSRTIPPKGPENNLARMLSCAR